MNDHATEAFIRKVLARAGFAEETYLPPARSQHVPMLRLVPNCGSSLKARTTPPRPSAA